MALGVQLAGSWDQNYPQKCVKRVQFVSELAEIDEVIAGNFLIRGEGGPDETLSAIFDPMYVSARLATPWSMI